jgi:elongation factor 2
MAAIKDIAAKVQELMNNPEQIRNIGTCAHIDHGKTTLSDNLLAGAGMISEELAGNIQAMDYDPQEKARGITINSANVSMIHTVDGKEFLVNLIDTPGHVDFGGEVTRAMRAIDTAIVLVDAVESIMPQTETVLRQALREGVKPVLFINKVDRLIKELKLPPEKMLERFTAIINQVNKIIRGLAPKEFKDAWTVNVQNGSVCFGSAKHRWALSIPYMKKKNFTLKQVTDAYGTSEDWAKLGRQIPLHEAVLDMIVLHGPNPRQSQKYRIPIIWHGETESEIGKSLLTCNPNGDTVFVVIKVIIDPQAGEVFTGRLFSGKITKGTELYLNSLKTREKAQQVFIYKGATRIPIETAIAGNIVGVVGLKNAGSGETASSSSDITPFEAIKHLFEPVVTKAIESKNPKDLPKLIEALKDIAKQDPTIAVTINEETGENLISGLGELHLEIWEYRIINDKNLQIVTSPPIVVYRETVKQSAKDIEGKSPNRHNKIYITVEPLPESVSSALKEGKIPEIKIKKRKREIEDALVEVGLDKDEAKQVVQIYKGNLLIEATRGLVHIGEIIEMVMEGFEEISRGGPIAKEPCFGLKIKITDAKLHEDAIHRGPGQMIPCTKQAITNAMLVAGAILYEPKQIIRIDIPTEYLNEATKLVAGRRGELQEVIQEEAATIVKAKVPVNEMFGFTAALRSATSGRGAWFLVDQAFEKLPNDLQGPTIRKLRERKGLPPDLPKPQFD